MELWLLGVTHDDPLARLALRSWLSHRSFRYKRAPIFVAPEWDVQQFDAMKAERPYMRELLSTEWGDEASDVLIDFCVSSIAFEGDTHRHDLFTEGETETSLARSRSAPGPWIRSTPTPVAGREAR
jgi:hypothetical protein